MQSCYYRYVMDNRLKRQAALYMLITLVDENNGSIDINAGTIRRFYNDEDQVVKVEHSDGTTSLAADLDGEELYDATLKWIADNPRKYKVIGAKIDQRFNDMIRGVI